MQQTQLQSLDELVLSIRDPESKIHTEEAIKAYYAGAYRASIMSIWVAVAIDIIAKIKELAADGDIAAIASITELNGYIPNDVRKLQDYENSLIDLAEKKFEFILAHEARDLEQLKNDRNRCAHPAFSGVNSLFSPTPEKARAHIVHAIAYVLSQPPTQGKKVIERFHKDLLGGAVPTARARMKIVLTDNYLARIRTGSRKEFTTSLIAAVLGNERARYTTKIGQLTMAVSLLIEVYPRETEDFLKFYLKSISSSFAEEKLCYLCPFIGKSQQIWSWIPAAGRERILAKISTLDVTNLLNQGAFYATNVQEICDILDPKIGALSDYELVQSIAIHPDRIFITEAITRLKKAGYFADSEKVAQEMLVPCAEFISEANMDHLAEVIEAHATFPYHQVLHARKMPEILLSIFERSKGLLPNSLAAWDKILAVASREGATGYGALISAVADAR